MNGWDAHWMLYRVVYFFYCSLHHLLLLPLSLSTASQSTERHYASLSFIIKQTAWNV